MQRRFVPSKVRLGSFISFDSDFFWLSFNKVGSATLHSLSLAFSGGFADMFSVFFAVQPLEQDVQHEIASENANGHEYSKRHLRLLAREE